MAVTTSGIVSDSVGRVQTSRPSRITVMVSAISKTSSRRWDTYSTVMPSAASSRRDAEQPLGLSIVERRVGFVEDEDARVLEQSASQLDELALTDARPPHRHRGVDVEPQSFEHRPGELGHLPSGHEPEPGGVVG